MATSARDLIDRARKTLCDPEKKHWLDDELMCYLNEGLCELAGLRPDQFVESRDITLVPGACQVVPDGCIDMVDVQANVKDGVKTEDPVLNATTTAGERLGDKFSCATADEPDCVAGETDACASYLVSGYKITSSMHGQFTVEPPVPAGCDAIVISALVYCEPSKFELDPPAGADECKLPTLYNAQLVDFILMRAYEKDVESQFAVSRASYHRTAFYTGVTADYRAASRLRSGYILGEEGSGSRNTGWRNEARGVFG